MFYSKPKTAYELRISDWSSDVCSSDLLVKEIQAAQPRPGAAQLGGIEGVTLGQPELAADHLVQRAHIADDVDALDKDPRALADRIVDVDNALLQEIGRAHV